MTDNNRLTDLVALLRSHGYIPTGKPNFLYENLAPGTVMEAADTIEGLLAALKPFADYWNTSKVVQISEWKNAYLTLNPQSENEPLGPSYGHDGEEK